MAHKKSKGEKRAAKVRKRERKNQERAKKQPFTELIETLDDRVGYDRFDDDLADDGAPIGLPDRRAIEGAMWRHFNDLTADKNPALARAQNMMYDCRRTSPARSRAACGRGLRRRGQVVVDCGGLAVEWPGPSLARAEKARLVARGLVPRRRFIRAALPWTPRPRSGTLTKSNSVV